MWLTWGVAMAADSAWILMDREAREAGVEVLVEDVLLDATLPVEVEQDVQLVVRRGEVERAGWVDAGLVYVISGPNGKIRATRPGVDVDSGAARVTADEKVVSLLAEDVGATWTPDGEGFLLDAPGLLYELSRAPIPAGDLELALVPLARPSAVRTPTRYATASAGLSRPGRQERRALAARGPVTPVIAPRLPGASVVGRLGHPVAPVASGARPAELAGWYCQPAGCVVLGVDGLAHRCADGGCAEAGPWSVSGEGLLVGELRYVWWDGQLVQEVQP